MAAPPTRTSTGPALSASRTRTPPPGATADCPPAHRRLRSHGRFVCVVYAYRMIVIIKGPPTRPLTCMYGSPAWTRTTNPAINSC